MLIDDLGVAKALNNTGNIVLVTGNPGQTDAVNRTEGMKSAFKAQGANIKILAEQMDGDIKKIESPGTKYELVFPLKV